MADRENSWRERAGRFPRRSRRRLPAAAVLLLCLGGGLQAQTLSGALSGLQASEVVFLGSLLEKESFLSKDERLIWTRHVFAVEEVIRGPRTETVEIYELGGTVGNVSLRVSHEVAYEPGPSYLIFARRDGRGRLQTWGGLDGRLPILDGGAGRRLVRVRAGSPLLQLLDRPRSAFQGIDEIRAKLMALGPPAEEAR